MKLLAFLGPTMTAAAAQKVARCEVWPPARQGDIWRALKAKPKAIALIDGVFEAQPSVWHHEIRAALAGGVAVFGAASMGALRAAELHRFGMVGIGSIFNAYRDGKLVDDGEVALLHADQEHHFRALTVPLVNVRHAAQVAVERRVLNRAEATRLVRAAKHLHYQRRQWRDVLDTAELKTQTRQRFETWRSKTDLDLKADDARRCLSAASEFVKSGAPSPAAPYTPSSFVRRTRLMQAEPKIESWLTRDDALEIAHTGLRRLALAEVARALGLSAPASRVQYHLEKLRRGHWLEDERLAAAQVLATEDTLLENTDRLISDGPSPIEGLALEMRLMKQPP